MFQVDHYYVCFSFFFFFSIPIKDTSGLTVGCRKSSLKAYSNYAAEEWSLSHVLKELLNILMTNEVRNCLVVKDLSTEGAWMVPVYRLLAIDESK